MKITAEYLHRKWKSISYLRQKDKFTISNLYELIVKTNPFNVKIVETPVTFCYGKYRIKFGGRTFYR